MKNKALKLINDYKMIEQGSLVTVGFSGGADSVALLYLLFDLKDQLVIDLRAVHINHNLRGKESDQDEAFARSFCEKLNIPFLTEKINTLELATSKKISIEQAAREERYRIFSKYSQAGKIATAHTLSDSIETMLINLTRGTGITGIIGIPPVRANIIRPLLTSTRTEIEQYCKENNLSFRTDSTNLEDVYTRNKIRNHIIPILNSVNPNFENQVAKTQYLLKNDAEYLDNLADDSLGLIKIENEYFLRKPFLKLPEVISSRIIIKILNYNRIEPNYDRIQFIYEKIKFSVNKTQLDDNFNLFCNDKSFAIKPIEKLTKSFEISFNKANLINNYVDITPEKQVKFNLLECEDFENIEKNYPERLKNLLDYDKIAVNVNFRQRKNADKFIPFKRGVTKTFKKLFNEAGLSLKERSSTIVLESENQIVWVEGFGSDQNFTATQKSRKVIEVVVKNLSLGE